jgi:hypothetical protein
MEELLDRFSKREHKKEKGKITLSTYLWLALAKENIWRSRRTASFSPDNLEWSIHQAS